ncbi:MAG: hypothetical protein KGK14_04200 [Bacteroidota bacterium]|jgi:hypothetical protein|nr:hypothetical protein [Bacteroidota bacterium]
MHRFYKAYNLIVKLLFFTLYILFFGVQLLFNFDAVPEDQIIDTELHVHDLFQPHQYFNKAIYTHNTSQRGDNIRLNKRYQPETVAATTFFVFSIIPLLFICIPYCKYQESFVSYFQYTPTLRGPPFACITS